MSSETLLMVRGLVVQRGWRVVIEGLDIDVCKGDRIHVVGENGSGKSTMLEALMGILPSVARQRAWLAETGTPLEAGALARYDLVYVPQTNNLFPSLTVRENLLLCSPDVRAMASRQLRRLLNNFSELQHYVDRRPRELSAGQRQFVAAARALLFQPKLLVLDEATAGMDPNLVELYHKQLADSLDGDTAVLAIDQHVEVVRRWATKTFAVVGPAD
jgi:ABC-type branched-subunit amino acid transport system ATPase component